MIREGLRKDLREKWKMGFFLFIIQEFLGGNPKRKRGGPNEMRQIIHGEEEVARICALQTLNNTTLNRLKSTSTFLQRNLHIFNDLLAD
jgi:hypothetical protein